MFKFIEFLKKRPSDMTIRIIRILFSLGIAALLVFAAGDYSLPFQQYFEAFALYAKYALAAIFVIHAIVFGFVGALVFKRKTMKYLQMAVGILMIVAGNLMAQTQLPAQTKATDSKVSISSLDIKTERKPVNVGFWFALLGLLPLIWGISGKLIMEKWLKYKEKITKIRV